jgi:hypothetical protein
MELINSKESFIVPPLSVDLIRSPQRELRRLDNCLWQNFAWLNGRLNENARELEAVTNLPFTCPGRFCSVVINPLF